MDDEMLWLALIACRPNSTEDSASSSLQTVPWSAGLPRMSAEVRGRSVRRGLIHLHSPYSHDACDGEGLPDGAVDAQCLADLRAGLCTTAMDFAYLTDHPAHAAEQDYKDLLLMNPNN